MSYRARYAEAGRNGARRRWMADGARRPDKGRPDLPVEPEDDGDPERWRRLARVVHVASYAEAPARCWEPLCRGPWRQVATGLCCVTCGRELFVKAALRKRR